MFDRSPSVIVKDSIAITAILFSALLPLAAQTTFGRISGTVTDPTKAGIPGARVTVRNVGTQDTRVVTTDSNGYYVAPEIPIGAYAVEVEQAGFKGQQQTGINISADSRITVDFHLQVGDVRQTVEVVAAGAEMLNTTSGEIAHVVDRDQVENLTLNGRSYAEFLNLIPGAVVTNPDQFGTLTSLSATNQSINGHRTNQNSLTIDGVGNLDNGSNGSLINNVSPDFLQEVKIQTSNFSAEYGRSAGAAFNIGTKYGTNEIHGGLFEYLRNDALDARNFFSATNTELRYNDWGYYLGGPIKKNKLFFFVGENWKKIRQQSAPARTTLPTTDQMAGNFGTKTIYYPGTKTPFPNNTIPASLITADGRAIMNVYKAVIPQAQIFTNTAVSNNVTFASPNPLDYREDLGRFDYKINDKHSLFGRWIDDYNSILVANGPGGNIPITPEIRDRPGKSVLLSETWVISPTLVNEGHFGASWNSQHYWNQGDTWDRSVEGFTFQKVYNSVGPYPNGIPDVTLQSFATFNGPAKTLISPTAEIEWKDTLSIIRGQHTIQTGVMVIRNRKDQNGRSAYDGSITFNTSGNPNTTNYALADALLGYYQIYTEAAYDPMGKYRYTEPAAFISDSWKATRKLSLDLGLRYEYMMAMYSTANNLSLFDPLLYNPAQAVKMTSTGGVVPNSGNIYNGLIRVANGINPSQAYLVPNANSAAVLSVPSGAPRGMYSSPSTWSPRIGFAYALNDKTVVRGGFGMFYDRIQGNPTFYTLNNPPYVGSTEFDYGNLSNITGGVTVSNPWGAIQTMSPHFRPPYAEEFSLSVQRELPWKLFWETSYVGSLGRRLLIEPDINQPSFATIANLPSTTNENSIRPYTGYSTIQQFISAGTSNYHSLQVHLRRRAGQVTFMGAFTWSKNLSDASSDTSNDLDYMNYHLMYGPAYSTSSAGSMDIEKVFVGTFVWRMPTLRQQPVYLRGPFGGWQLSGVTHLQSGPYLTVTGSTAILGTRMADYLGGPVALPNPGPNGWFNPAAFAAAPQGRWGTTGAGNAQGPGMQIYNLSVQKIFAFHERFNLRFRVDFVNALNHTNFQMPATTITSSNFGTISSAYPARNIQLGMKLTF
jgi:hypothetical protein